MTPEQHAKRYRSPLLVAWGALATLIVGGLSILAYRLTTTVLAQLLGGPCPYGLS